MSAFHTVVLSDTKIQIWKQFTTKMPLGYDRSLLYYLIQRYKFESNSQHISTARKMLDGCIIWYKDTNLKAIHNRGILVAVVCQVVLSDTKIQIWKQFTTPFCWHQQKDMLYYLIQRYKFESNSQHDDFEVYAPFRCIIWYKDTNLKAIHNRFTESLPTLDVVLSDTKIQIWKQFTTLARMTFPSSTLYYLIQRYKFESNSQPVGQDSGQGTCCIIWYKDTNLKAIHNKPKTDYFPQLVVLSDTKIQIWKQFTTEGPWRVHGLRLYYLIQRYKFESNSQHKGNISVPHLCCIIWYKDTNLKAIHNSCVLS